MGYSLLCQNSATGAVYDATTLATNISHQTTLDGQPGKLSFTLQDDPKNILQLTCGSIVSFTVDGTGVFYGYIFTMSVSEDGLNKVTAYDQMRYLKNQELYITADMTASQIFERVCADSFPVVPPALPRYKVITPSTYVVPTYNHEKSTLYSVIEYGMQRANIAEQKQYFLKDKFGTLLFTELAQEKTNIVLGDKSLLTGYQYEVSIDKNTYNTVKVFRANEATGRWESWIQQDPSTRNLWGTLQMVQEADSSYNEAQIRELANNIWRLRNRETKTMKVNALGVPGLDAGSGFMLSLNDLDLNQFMWITSATHNYERDYHSMQLSVFI